MNIFLRVKSISLEEIMAAYAPLVDLAPNPDQDPGSTADTPNGSEPSPVVTKAEVNQTLEVLHHHVIQTARSAALQQQPLPV